VTALSTHAKGVLIAGTGGIVLSFEAVLVRLLDLTPWTILAWRGVLMGVSLVVLFWLGWARGRRLLSELTAGGRWALLAGVLFAIDNVLFIVALSTTSVANTLFILSAAPALSGLLSLLFLGERPTPRLWIVIGVVMAGVAVIVSGGIGSGDVRGDLAALGAALAIAGTLVVIRRARGIVMLPAIALGSFLAAMFAAPFAALASPDVTDVALLGVIGLVVAPVAFGCISLGPRYLQAPEVSLLMRLETVLGPVWALIILGEVPAVSTVVGGVVIVVAIVAHSVLTIRRTPGLPVAAPRRSGA
jgi:drug/metabolite transporter (DMT)-like permease